MKAQNALERNSGESYQRRRKLLKINENGVAKAKIMVKVKWQCGSEISAAKWQNNALAPRMLRALIAAASGQAHSRIACASLRHQQK